MWIAQGSDDIRATFKCTSYWVIKLVDNEAHAKSIHGKVLGHAINDMH